MNDKFIPKEALDYIKNKNLKIGFSYKDVWNEEHATSFTVAKAMQLDILSDIKNALEKALEDGQSFESFKKNIKPTLQQKGWWGKKEMVDPLTGDIVKAQLGSDRRLNIIYDTNIRQAYQKGQYERTMQSDLHPYLMYRVGNSVHHRKDHLAWDGLILPKDDPWWNNHFPQREFRCQCFTRAISEARKKRYEKDGIIIPPKVDGTGGDVLHVQTTRPKESWRNYYNERNETIERLPKGVAPGFNWHPGTTRRDLASFDMFLKKGRDKIPEQIEEVAKTYLTNTIHRSAFDNFIEQVYDGKLQGDYSMPTGFLDRSISTWLKKNKNIDVGDANVISLEARLLAKGSPKADRHSKAGDAIGKRGARIIVDTLLYGNVYFDKNSSYLIYLFPHSENKLIKITVAPVYKIKYSPMLKTSSVRNIQTIDSNRKDEEYQRIMETLEKIR